MNPRNDFDLDALTRQSNLHEQVLNDLYNRVGTDEKLGNSFKEAFTKNKEFDKVITEIIVDNLDNNLKIRKSLEKVVKTIDRKWWSNNIARAIFYIFGIVSTIAAQLIIAKIGS